MGENPYVKHQQWWHPKRQLDECRPSCQRCVWQQGHDARDPEITALKAELLKAQAACVSLKRLVDLQITEQTEEGLSREETVEMRRLLQEAGNASGSALLAELEALRKVAECAQRAYHDENFLGMKKALPAAKEPHAG